MLTTTWKIHTLSWTRDRQPIKRSKLAYEVAKKLKQYLNRMTVRSHRNGIDLVFSQGYCRGLLRTNLSKIGGGLVEVSCSSTICSWSISYLSPRDPSNQKSGWRTLRLTCPCGLEINEVSYLLEYVPPSQFRNEHHLYLFHNTFLCPISRAHRTDTF